MKMVYKILADVVVLIHFLWILFLLFGAFWGMKSKAAKIFHLSGFAFALLLQFSNWYCPLTYLEIWLRSKHSPSLSYTGSFIIHYLERLVYIEISRSTVLAFTLLLCAVNGWLYLRKRR